MLLLLLLPNLRRSAFLRFHNRRIVIHAAAAATGRPRWLAGGTSAATAINV